MAAVDESAGRCEGHRFRARALLTSGFALLSRFPANACAAPAGCPDRVTALSTGTADRAAARRRARLRPLLVGVPGRRALPGPGLGARAPVLSAGPLAPLSAAEGRVLVAARDSGFRPDADVPADRSAEVSVSSRHASRGPLTQTRTPAPIPP